MNIHEYQAKDILRQYGIPTGKGVVAFNKQDIDKIIDDFDSEVYVVKAQIHAGGRGKAGGVKIAKTKEEAKKIAHEIYGMNLVTHQTGPGGQIVRRIYIESGCDIKKEYYFSLVLDRENSCITAIASTEGGVNIEEIAQTHPHKIIKVQIDPSVGFQAFHGRKIAFGLELTGNAFKSMTKIAESCYNAFVLSDANQIEINPLVQTGAGDMVALDGKINFDENAGFRQSSILALRDEDEEDPYELEATKAGLSYIRMDGNIGCMVNGAGLAMSTMDIIKYYGAEPANFLDVGGGADKARVSKAFKIILSDPGVKAVLVNIFGGIMKCDVIAEGIVAAAQEVELKIPLVVRLAGTNVELGQSILEQSSLDIISASDLADAAQKATEAVKLL